MSTGGGTSTTTTVQQLSPEQQQLLSGVIPIAMNELANPPSMYPGSTISPFNQNQLTAQQMTMDAANSMVPVTSQIPSQLTSLMNGYGNTAQQAQQGAQQGASQLGSIMGAQGQAASNINPTVQHQTQQTQGQLQGAQGATAGAAANTNNAINSTINQNNANTSSGLNFLTSGNVLNANSNPALSGAISAATQPIVQNFQNSVLPSIQEDAISNGGYGGTRQGIATGLAAQGEQQQVANTAASMANTNYQTGLNAMTSGLNTAVTQGGQNLNAQLGAGQLTQSAANNIMQSILGGGQLAQSGTLGAANATNSALGNLINGNISGQNAAQNWLNTQNASLGAQSNLLGNEGNILSQMTTPAQLVGDVGQQQQAMSQAQLTEQAQDYVNQQMIPFSVAQDVASMAMGLPGGSTKSTSTGASNTSGIGSMLGGVGSILGALPLGK